MGCDYRARRQNSTAMTRNPISATELSPRGRSHRRNSQIQQDKRETPVRSDQPGEHSPTQTAPAFHMDPGRMVLALRRKCWKLRAKRDQKVPSLTSSPPLRPDELRQQIVDAQAAKQIWMPRQSRTRRSRTLARAWRGAIARFSRARPVVREIAPQLESSRAAAVRCSGSD